MKICPYCNSEIDESTGRCSHCDRQLYYCLKCGAVSSGRHCRVCGAVTVPVSDRASMIAMRPSQRFAQIIANIDITAASDVGKRRSNNEDMLLVGHEYVRNSAMETTCKFTGHNRYCVMVADGMGGVAGGEYASELIVKLFERFIDGLPVGLSTEDLKSALNRWTLEAHEVVNKGGGNPSQKDMGTTMAGCFCYGTSMYWLNVGDSRVYLLRDGIFRQITNDHTLRNLMHDDTIPSNVIYNSFGGGVPDVFVDFGELPIYTNDRMLICSDGLSDMIDDETLKKSLEAGYTAKQLVQLANAAGGHDNISVITMHIK